MNILYKIKAIYLDKGSVLVINEYNEIDSFYLPNENKCFNKSSWNESYKKLFNETFKKLDDDIYFVEIPVVTFYILNSFSMNDSDYDDSEMGLSEMINVKMIWEDIKADFKAFDRYGQSELVKTVIIKEHWSQCWEGDYDCNHEYVGILNTGVDSKNLVTEKSYSRLEKRELEFKKWQYGF